MQIRPTATRLSLALLISASSSLAPTSIARAQSSTPSFDNFEANQKKREEADEQNLKNICLPQLSKYGVDEASYSETTSSVSGLRSLGGFLCMFTRSQMIREFVKTGNGAYSVIIGNVNLTFEKRKFLESDSFYAPITSKAPGKIMSTITSYNVDGADYQVQNFDAAAYLMMALVQAMGAPPAD